MPESEILANVTVLPVPTLRSENVAVAVPVTLTESTEYGLPSVLLALNAAATAVCNAAVPDTAATSVPSYTLFALDNPLTVNAFAVMFRDTVACAESV